MRVRLGSIVASDAPTRQGFTNYFPVESTRYKTRYTVYIMDICFAPPFGRVHCVTTTFLVVLALLAICLLPAGAEKVMYTYTDDRGQPVITDDYSSIPSDRRAKVTVRGEAEKSGSPSPFSLQRIDESIKSHARGFVEFIGGKAIEIPGMSLHQSKILNYAGIIVIVCLLGMNLSRGQGIRFLSLWCLIMTCIGTPLLLYTSQDGPADIMKKKAAQIEEKHSQRMQ